MSIIETAGWLATGIALIGVWLNNKHHRACFGLWLVSNATTFGIHVVVGMWALASRDAAFFVLAIHGWLLWTRQIGKVKHEILQSPGRGT